MTILCVITTNPRTHTALSVLNLGTKSW